MDVCNCIILKMGGPLCFDKLYTTSTLLEDRKYMAGLDQANNKML